MTPGPPPRLLLAVAAGGAVGAVARYAATELVADGRGFPWTTFAVNVSGSALLAALLLLPLARRSPTWAAALGPGVLGGYTTFSATSEQARALLADGRAGLALAYVAGTLAACLVAVSLVGLLAPSLPEEDEL
ncbi:CrcB family protein [Nocardioides carbamazepini]|uniref:fluoride efflux transporter FluC n=1 Tax=Nocardioides carbamazepini TaxID=2854259 RepID=UPI00214A7157|nr:CrcB family protein [Nocardioides carbamazepini]MCR1786119.1 CrcB family protein [Nocardioides carbamazepini]